MRARVWTLTSRRSDDHPVTRRVHGSTGQRAQADQGDPSPGRPGLWKSEADDTAALEPHAPIGNGICASLECEDGTDC